MRKNDAFFGAGSMIYEKEKDLAVHFCSAILCI